MTLTIDEYQKRAAETAIYRAAFMPAIKANSTLSLWNGLAYCALKLAAEAGEVAQEIAKAQRDDDYRITADRYEKLFGELGDVQWYVSQLCTELGFRLEDVMDHNLAKLKDRQERKMLKGSGSNR